MTSTTPRDRIALPTIKWLARPMSPGTKTGCLFLEKQDLTLPLQDQKPLWPPLRCTQSFFKRHSPHLFKFSNVVTDIIKQLNI